MSRHRPSKEVDSRNRTTLGFMTLAERAPSKNAIARDLVLSNKADLTVDWADEGSR
jgi:hypothetical protein